MSSSSATPPTPCFLVSFRRIRSSIVFKYGCFSGVFLLHADQGQGGGQAIEDAEALAVVLPTSTPAAAVPERLQLAERIRYERATRIQSYSREKALGPKPGEKVVNAQEHAAYNFGYAGARDYAEKHGIALPVSA